MANATDNNLVLYTDRKANYLLLSTIYDPDVDQDQDGKIVPPLMSLVLDDYTENTGQLYYVSSVDKVTLKVTYKKAKLVVSTEDQYTQYSIVSYRNDIFSIYADMRTVPTRLSPDKRLKFYGINLSHYRLVRNRGTPNEEVVSVYHDSDGLYTTEYVPIIRVGTEDDIFIFACTECHTSSSIAENEMIYLEVYNIYGACIDVVNCFMKHATIINEINAPISIITDFTITAIQMRSNNEIFLYEKQSVDSLMIRGLITYSDGRVVEVYPDETRTFLDGLSDFNPSWSGLQQPILLRHFLTRDEQARSEILQPGGRVLAAEANLVVVPNELGVTVKISVIPYWNRILAQYHLKYFLYTTDRNFVIDVSSLVNITEGSFNSTLYGVFQNLTLALDLSLVQPLLYSESVYHTQTFAIKLQPIAALEKYIFKDSPSNKVIYGIDTTEQRRPVLKYDNQQKLYYIPTGLFRTTSDFLNAYYYAASPPYRLDSELAPVLPTHFLLRDAFSGTSILSTPIKIEDYNKAIRPISSNGEYVGNTIIFEFIQEINQSSSLILYGSPVDVSLGSTFVG